MLREREGVPGSQPAAALARAHGFAAVAAVWTQQGGMNETSNKEQAERERQRGIDADQEDVSRQG